MKRPSDRAIYVLLFAATVVVYARVFNYPFVSYDDDRELFGNPYVRQGLSAAGVAWAFRFGTTPNWVPVTWISHMFDFQFFSFDAGLHHLTNVLIHASSAVLLLALLKRMTGRLWESLFVASVFALHPQHVESVAWVSERKDVLFAFFWFLTTWLYLDFLAKRTVPRYLLMVAAFSLGLMSKQMIVTMPFSLLLLDLWPLKRKDVKALVLEKVPLIVLAIAASVITFLAQRHSGATRAITTGAGARIANALISYILYLRDFLWPTRLAVFYPYPTQAHVAEAVFAGLALTAISVAVVLAFGTRPYLAVGWFWFLGTLLPVIGLIQVGFQARADRYTYVPLIGISIMVAWGAAEAPGAGRRAPVQAAMILMGLAWAIATWRQTGYWHDSITLYRHAIAVTDGNYRAHENLGVELGRQGKFPEALRELTISIEENPEQANAHNTMGGVLSALGRNDEAMIQFADAVRIEPDHAQAHSNLGNELVSAGRIDEAIDELNTALRLNPRIAGSYYGMGRVRAKQNRLPEAMAWFSRCLRIDPSFVQARQQLDALRRP